MYLVRKITRAKWDVKRDGLADDEIPADAVTADLRTFENRLSFWRCETTSDNDIKEAMLAIAAAPSKKKIEKIQRVEVIWISEDDLQNSSKELEDTEGETLLKRPGVQHVDWGQLDYTRLGEIAHHVVNALNREQYKKKTESEVKKLIKSAVKQGRIDTGSLEEKVREKIQKN